MDDQLNSETFSTEKEELFANQPPWVERNGFAHWAVALGWIFVALIGFQVVGAVGAIIALLVTAEDLTDPMSIMENLETDYDILFFGNTLGQVTIIGLATLLIVKIHATKGNRMHFLRLQKGENTVLVSILGVALFTVAFPAVGFLGWLNSLIPVPELFTQLQETMMEMITGFLKTDNALMLGIFHIAIVPAVCEEILFRGYLQRSFEKKMGITGAILLSGLLFGMYHLQLTNVIPLAVLGVFLAYLTWISESLIPAMIAHLFNNGSQVVAGVLYPDFMDNPEATQFDLSQLPLVILSFAATGGLLYVLMKIKKNKSSSDGII